MDRLAGAQLLNFWYSCRMPLSEILNGSGASVGLGTAEGAGVSVTLRRLVCVGTGAIAVRVACTMASTCS